MTPYLLLVAAYIVGAVPFGLLVAKWFAGVDVREHGSGNIGATNVFRVAGKPAGITALALDIAKGLWPPIVAHALHLSAGWVVGAGLAAIVGHTLSPFLGFQGGKGVATTAGALLGMAWQVGVGATLLWIVMVALTGYVSLASMAAAISLTPLSLLFYPGDWVRLAFMLVVGVYVIYRHRANIQRLRAGTENRFGRKAVDTDEKPETSRK